MPVEEHTVTFKTVDKTVDNYLTVTFKNQSQFGRRDLMSIEEHTINLKIK